MKRISKEAEAVVFREFQSGDEEAFTKIFQQFEPLALSRVRMRMVSPDYKHLQPDLESDVRLALWNAAKTFNPAKGCRFSTYLIPCLDNTINRKIREHCKERECIEKYRNETSEECVVDVNSDSDTEIAVNDRFPFHDEPISPELALLCKPKALAILGLIHSDEDVQHKNGNLNNAAIARKLGISRETVRQTIKNLGTNQLLKSTLYALVHR